MCIRDSLYDAVDISNAVNFLAVATIVGHFDSEVQNFFLHHDTQDTGDRPATGRWQIYPWDLSNAYGVGGPSCTGDELNLDCVESKFWDAIFDVPELEEMVFRRMRTLLDGPVSDGELEGLAAAYMATVSTAESDADEAMWSSVIGYNSPNRINNDIDNRRDALLALDDLPGSQPVAPGIVISELVYRAAGDGPDWLELHNPTNESVDISGWEIDGVDLTVPGGTVLLAGDYLVATESVVDFRSANPGTPNTVLVQFDGGLQAEGEEVQLLNAAGTLIDLVHYNSDDSWPTEPLSSNVSLSLFDPAEDNAASSSWGVSVSIGGTPGVENDTEASQPVPLPDVVINEVHYHQADGDGDTEFIELFNAGSTSADISSFDLDGLIIFDTGTTIAPGGYLVVTENLADFSARYPGVPAIEWPSGGSLSNTGENITLDSDLNVRLDSVDYEDRAPWPSAPDGTGPSLSLIAPALDNSIPQSWFASDVSGGTPGAPNGAPVCNGLPVTVDVGAGDVPTAGDDVILGTAGDDVIVAGGGDDTVCAGDGEDVVLGGAGKDTILGGAGDDLLSGNDGDDVIDGQSGADTVFGGSGNDTISGGAGDDVLGAGSDTDTVSGGGGADRISGGSGADGLISGGVGNDAVNGGGGNDANVRGDAGNDTVSGNGGKDVVSGGDGDDVVRGGQADDIVNGDAGDDFVAGNSGNDTCDGGTGGEIAGDTAAPNCETVTNVP